MGPSETFSMRIHYHGITVFSETEVSISDDWQSYQLSHCSTNASFCHGRSLAPFALCPTKCQTLVSFVAGINGIVPKEVSTDAICIIKNHVHLPLGAFCIDFYDYI
ncbi:hypothetical protein CEXT_404581 [Caerostris extrusa]|uniref:Uncharacterized protein n=1 Tax=Caerostris extrusa TaxID=172846 RepID=A0AAV4N4W3_CAEEX|nr:hypothetical protein CEXT_404581 [Caerostris extrusa]